MSFPQDFVWGAATASYQIEGSALRAGGGKSVWDMFCERPGAVYQGENGWQACDHYLHYEADAKLMGDLGLKAYRFSLSWPRILPDGVGAVNRQGLDFYDKLVDALLAGGVDPWVTLFHWDYPYALYNQGGWLNPDSSRWFADYTQVVVDKLSDRVTHWMTLNEPQCFIGLGHLDGIHAPGDKLQLSQVLLAAHNSLLAHGRAVQVIRASSKSPAPQIGAAPVGVSFTPADPSNPADVEAARQATFSIADPKSTWNSILWFEPCFTGQYPQEAFDAYGKDMVKPAPGDMEIIGQPLDFLGANIYQSSAVKAGENGKPVDVDFPVGIGRTVMDWPVTPDALYWGPKFFYDRYKKPVVVTENGMAGNDWIQADGQVQDPARIDFLTRYLRAFKRARDEGGVETMGYFQWSLMDNFEWAEGYKKRFGLVYVDYQTQQRIPKSSAHWYKAVIESNGEML